MKKSIFLIIYLRLTCFVIPAQVGVDHLLCENKTNPLGVEIMQPRFTWQLISDKRNVMQTAYEIRVSNDLSAFNNDKNIVWSTGKISSVSRCTFHMPAPQEGYVIV